MGDLFYNKKKRQLNLQRETKRISNGPKKNVY